MQDGMPRRATRRARRIVTMRKILSTVCFTLVAYFDIGLPLAVLPPYVHDQLGFGAVMAGFAVSAAYISTLLSRALAGRMADLIGPKRAVLIGLLADGASGLLLAAVPLVGRIGGGAWSGMAVILASRLFLGIGESWVSTSSIAWAIRQVGPRNTAVVISWNGVATYGGIAAGAPVGVLFADAFGFEAVGGLTVLLSLVAFPLALLKRASPPAVGTRLPFRTVAGQVMPFGWGLSLGGLGFGTIAAFITLYYASLHWGGASQSLTLFSLGFVATRLIFGNVIDRFGGYRVALASFAGEVAGLTLLALAPTSGVAMAGAALSGFGFSLVFPALAVEAVQGIPDNSRGTALGFYSVFLDVSLGFAGPLVGLVVAQAGYRLAFLTAALAALAGGGLTWMLYRRVRRTRPAG